MSKRVKKKENISYTLSESEKEEEKVDINQLMEDFEDIQVETPESGMDDDVQGEDYLYAQVADYEANNTSKQLACIYEYYNMGSITKLKKIDMAERIVSFENDADNFDVVSRRQTLWFYLQELKRDPYTKKFVWSSA
jgi:hypothetical protein